MLAFTEVSVYKNEQQAQTGRTQKEAKAKAQTKHNTLYKSERVRRASNFYNNQQRKKKY